MGAISLAINLACPTMVFKSTPDKQSVMILKLVHRKLPSQYAAVNGIFSLFEIERQNNFQI